MGTPFSLETPTLAGPSHTAAGMGLWCCFQLRSRVATETDPAEFFPSPEPARGIRAAIHSVQGKIPPNPADSLPSLTPQAQQSSPQALSVSPAMLSSCSQLPKASQKSTQDTPVGFLILPPLPLTSPLLGSIPSDSLESCSTSLIQHQVLGQWRRPWTPSGRRERVWECQGKGDGGKGSSLSEVSPGRAIPASLPPCIQSCLSIIHPPSGELSHPNKNVTRNPRIHPYPAQELREARGALVLSALRGCHLHSPRAGADIP